SGKNRPQCLTALMGSVHTEDVSYRRNDEFILMREVQAVQTVDQLRARSHRYFLGMTVEGIQRHATEYRIPQRDHLLQLISGSHFAAGTIPRSPFVHDQLHPVL